jgi:toxin FitB
MIVLDTNVVSEHACRARTGSARVAPTDFGTGLYTTAVAVAEIRYDVARLPEGRRRQTLHQAADEIFAAFPRQVLPFDLAAATAYADVVAGCESDDNPISGFNAQIAAICRSPAATLATRNTKGFTDPGISITDPWQATAA